MLQEIGRRREARTMAGLAYDGVLMDILEDEFREKYPLGVCDSYG